VTRVGAGPFPTELFDDIGEHIVDRGREFGTTTGRRRRPGWFDAVLLRHAARLNTLTELGITKLDVLDELDVIRVCVGYELNGKTVKHVPYHQSEFFKIKPVYEDLPGWQTDTSTVTTWDALPPQAQSFLRFIEKHVGVAVTLVGVGPGRDQYLEVPAA
jgi:adenylosuccinate synthase